MNELFASMCMKSINTHSNFLVGQSTLVFKVAEAVRLANHSFVCVSLSSFSVSLSLSVFLCFSLCLSLSVSLSLSLSLSLSVSVSLSLSLSFSLSHPFLYLSITLFAILFVCLSIDPSFPSKLWTLQTAALSFWNCPFPFSHFPLSHSSWNKY